MRSSPVALALFATISFGCIKAAPQSPAGWTTHNDEKGFSISMPPGWNLVSNGQAGRIIAQGSTNEKVVIWPASIQQSIDSRGASALAQQMARQVDSQMPWSAAVATGGAVRTTAKAPQRSGTAVMTWKASAPGTSVLFYCVEAPASSYQAETETFAAILRSFRSIPASTAPGQPGTGANANPAAPITYTTWHEPRENAYTLAVPQGWQAVGGIYRLSASDVRTSVVMASPDGQIRVRFGDSNLGSFTQPSPMLGRAGLREGMYYGIGDGTRELIYRYLAGPQAAQFYTQTYLLKECSGLQMASANPRPGIARAFVQRARSEGMPNAQITAGEVTFRCNMKGMPVDGKTIAATVLPIPQGGLWYFYRLYGYLAAEGREQDAERVADAVVQSWRPNPQWQAQQQQIANSAVLADNARSQQIRQQSMQAIQKDEQETSNIIMNGWEQRNQIQSEISRRQENAILSMLDVVDPQTGEQYKISNYSDYHWMNNSGVIAGNNTGDSPGPDWRQMVTLPY